MVCAWGSWHIFLPPPSQVACFTISAVASSTHRSLTIGRLISYLPPCSYPCMFIGVVHLLSGVSHLHLRLYLLFEMSCNSTTHVESVVAIPPHGVQIETHRGLAGIPFSVSRRFIPTFLFRDLIINEALRRWNVVYYLSVLSVTHDSEYKLDIIFEVNCVHMFLRNRVNMSS